MQQWRYVFFIAAIIYVFCATFYNIFGSGVRQPWDNPMLDDPSAMPMHNGVNGNANGNANGNTNGNTSGQQQTNGNGLTETRQ